MMGTVVEATLPVSEDCLKLLTPVSAHALRVWSFRHSSWTDWLFQLGLGSLHSVVAAVKSCLLYA